GPDTELIDARRGLIAPGLIEPHTHMVRLGMRDTVRLSLAAGVTGIVIEGGEFGFICGPGGFRELLAEASALPGRVFLTVPPLVALDPAADSRLGSDEEWVAFLDHEAVVGVGEVYWAD